MLGGQRSEIHVIPSPSALSAGAGSAESRSRHSSYPTGSEEDDGNEEELSPFRGRSRSAPPNLWAAQRYGRELRRMSDEFQGSFKVSAAPTMGGPTAGASRDPYSQGMPGPAVSSLATFCVPGHAGICSARTAPLPSCFCLSSKACRNQ